MAVVTLEVPRFQNRGPLLIAGLSGRYTADTLDDLPELWERFSVYIGNLPGQVGRVAYGICSDMVTGTGSFRLFDGSAGFLERYGEHFNPQLGIGDIEVWIPLTA